MEKIIILLLLLNPHNLKFNYQIKQDSVEYKIYKDNWFGEDKFFHFSLSSLLVGSSYHLLKCRLEKDKKSSAGFSLISTFLIGIGKEIYDKKIKKEFFSYKDLIYDVLGIFCGYFLFIY
ncbi:MAG: hypothetical protein ABIK78_06935 [candidate division WOR-3 bacterium]